MIVERGARRAKMLAERPARRDEAVAREQRAGFISRFCAFFIDTVALAAALRVSAWLLAGLARLLGRFAPPVDLGNVVIAICPPASALYFVVSWATSGQTLGKWVMGLRVVAGRGGKANVGVARAALRLAGYAISALPFYLGFLWILGPERRGWHDRLARTEVVYVARRRAVQPPLLGRGVRSLDTATERA